MRAGLEIEIKRAALGPFPSRFNRKHLSMLDRIVGVAAFANDLAFGGHQYGSHTRVGRRQGDASAGKLKGLVHITRVIGLGCHGQLNRESTKSLELNGNRSPTFSPTPT